MDPRFDATRENLGMVTVGVVVLVFWLLYRKMIELSRLKAERATPWRETLRAAGVTEDFLEALGRVQRGEAAWPWLKAELLGASNATLFSDGRDFAAWLGLSPLARAVPVFAERGDAVFVVWVDDARGRRFVRVGKDDGVRAEYRDFQAVLEALLKTAWQAGVGEAQVRRLGESVGFVETEAVLRRLQSPDLALA